MKNNLFPNLYKVVNLCPCFCLPPPASSGLSGRPSRVVWGQSHASKLDWRVHRLPLRFQTQGESMFLSHCSLFIHSSFSLTFNLSTCFPVATPSQPLFFISFSPSTDCLLYSGFLDAYVYLCISIKNHVPKHKNLLFVVCIQGMHPSASGNLPKQMMSQISFYSVFLEPYLQFFICLSFQSEQLQKAH